MVIQCPASAGDSAVPINIFVHDITGRPLAAQYILSSVGKGSQMGVHLSLRFCDTDRFISPYLSGLLSGDVGIDISCHIGILVDNGLVIGKHNFYPIPKIVLQSVPPPNLKLEALVCQVGVV